MKASISPQDSMNIQPDLERKLLLLGCYSLFLQFISHLLKNYCTNLVYTFSKSRAKVHSEKRKKLFVIVCFYLERERLCCCCEDLQFELFHVSHWPNPTLWSDQPENQDLIQTLERERKRERVLKHIKWCV